MRHLTSGLCLQKRCMTMTDITTASGAIGVGRGGRMSRQRKRDAVLRLLRGEDLEMVSRSLGVTAATLTTWRDSFLAAGRGFPGGPAHGWRDARERAAEGAARQNAAQARTAGTEDYQPGGRTPFGSAEVEAMSCTVSPSSGKSYGLALVCRAWRTPRATVYRHRAPPMTQPTQRRGPVGPMPDAALLAAIRAVLAASPFHGEGHRKVWATA